MRLILSRLCVMSREEISVVQRIPDTGWGAQRPAGHGIICSYTSPNLAQGIRRSTQ